jgi:ankyrin repeat protein
MAYEANDIIARMIQPESLKSEAYQPWSQGRGIDVWAMICASISGDIETIKTLVTRDPNLINCEYEYFTPIHFAVRENQRQVVDFLLQEGVNPVYEAGDSLVTIARDRGYHELTAYLESILKDRYHIVPEGKEIAAAIRAFDMGQVQKLIERQPALVHAADERGNQSIHWAVLTRQLELIDYLLEHGANINAMRPDGAKPLDLTNGDYHYRSWYRDLPPNVIIKHEVVVDYLMARGAYCDICVAAKMGYYDHVKELLEKDAALVNRLPSYVSYYSGLPLRCAAGAGHVEIVKLLLQRGANPNEPEPGIAPQGGALHAAIGGKHFEIVKLLLQHGANADAEVESSGNCLFMAKYVDAPQEIIDLIASHTSKPPAGSDSQVIDLDTLKQMLQANPKSDADKFLGSIINEEKREYLDLILRYQPDILSRKTINPSAWWDNSTFKSPEAARWLMECGLSPNLGNWLGIRPLHRCASKSDILIADVLLGFGADINSIETEWYSTPLGWAARHGQKDMVEWLLKKGADPTQPENELWALPLAWAERRGYKEIAELLKQHGANE